MRKKAIDLVIITLSIVLIAVSWLYITIGPALFWILILIAICYGIWHLQRRQKKSKEAYQELILCTLQRKISQTEAKSINHSLMRTDFRKAQLLRSIQILTESIDIALASKKQDIIESRFDTVMKEWNEVQTHYSDLISEENIKTLKEIIASAEKNYHTTKYTNVAKAYLDKADSLKTEKSKQKYRGLAKEILSEGMLNPMSNKPELKELLLRIERQDI